MSMNCDVQFIDPTASISDFTYSGNTLTVQLSNADDIDFDHLSVRFGYVDCENLDTSNAPSSISCTTSIDIVSGLDMTPQVYSLEGKIPMGSATTYSEAIYVTSVSPTSDLNPKGGNTIVISGSHFPHGIDAYISLAVTFDDGSECTLISSSANEIICKTNEFASGGSSPTMTIALNGQTTTQGVSVSSSSTTLESISPDNYSPVLKTDLIFVLSADYTGDWNPNNFDIKLVPQDSESTTRTLNVYKTDSSTRELTVRYGGAYSGVYDITINDASYGEIDTNGLTFEAIGIVSSISPLTGSMYGGTVLTITGYTFSDDMLDNPIQIGSNDCYIIDSSATEITCRTPYRPAITEEDEDVYVYLKTSELA